MYPGPPNSSFPAGGFAQPNPNYPQGGFVPATPNYPPGGFVPATPNYPTGGFVAPNPGYSAGGFVAPTVQQPPPQPQQPQYNANPSYPVAQQQAQYNGATPYPNMQQQPQYNSPTAYPNTQHQQQQQQPQYQGANPYPNMQQQQQPQFAGANPYPNTAAPAMSPYPTQQPPVSRPVGPIGPGNQGALQQVQPAKPTVVQQPVKPAVAKQPTQNQLPKSADGIHIYKEVPTIQETKFDPQVDAKAWHKYTLDSEDLTFDMITQRTNLQRQQVVQAYKTLFSRDIVDDIESATSGRFRDILVGLWTPRFEFMATAVREAIEGIGTNEQVLIDVICTSNEYQELREIQKSYSQLFGVSMQTDIEGDTTGWFEKLLIKMCSSERRQNTKVDSAQVTKDAKDLKEAGIKRMGTDEATFINIFTNRSYPHLRAVFVEYAKITGQDIEKSIKSEFSGDVKNALLTVAQCAKNRAAYFAERFYKSMKGLGTNDKLLIYLTVTRADVDLENIKQEYLKMYKKTLSAAIKSDTSGDYKRTLMEIVD